MLILIEHREVGIETNIDNQSKIVITYIIVFVCLLHLPLQIVVLMSNEQFAFDDFIL
jgi:hypothetical protein